MVDHPQIGNGPALLVHQCEHLVEIHRIGQIILGMRTGDQSQFGTQLIEEHFNHFPVMVDFVLKIRDHSFARKAGIMQVDSPTDEEQRQQGTEKRQGR